MPNKLEKRHKEPPIIQLKLGLTKGILFIIQVWKGKKKGGFFFQGPIWLKQGHIVPPLSRICVYLCKYAYERIEKT